MSNEPEEYPVRVKDQARFEQEFAANQQAYEELKDQIRREYGSQYVAIAHGRLVGPAPTFEEATAMALKLQPRPEHFVVFEADSDPMFDIIDDPYTELLAELPEES